MVVSTRPVFDVITPPARLIWGWATVDTGADLLTVTANGHRATTHMSGISVAVLARHLLRYLHQTSCQEG